MSIHLAQVESWGSAPKYVSAPSPPSPAADADTIRIKVLATGVHSLVRLLASGKHYVVPPLPYVPGSDGVGIVPAENNRKVYFTAMSPRATGGSFREILDVPRGDVFDLPDGVEPTQAAALMNPGQSSWMAIRKRTFGLKPGFGALVLGATSVSGKLAAHLLRELGAGKVNGVARREDGMRGLGLDRAVLLRPNPDETDWAAALDGVDVVLDYVYGEALLSLLKALKPGKRVQVVQIGSVGGGQFNLDAGVLRGRDVYLTGNGLGTVYSEEIMEEYPKLLAALSKIPKQEVTEVKLGDVETAWTEAKGRLVFTL